MTDETAQPRHSVGKPLGRAVSRRLLERVHSGDAEAVAELDQLLSAGLKLLIRRQLGPEGVDDRARETFRAVVQGIQRNGLSNPELLPSFVRETLHDKIARHGVPGPAPLPGGAPDSIRAMREVLASLPAHEREALTRFYVLEQPAEQIIEELGVSAETFRAIKTRAKKLFVEMKQSVPAEPLE
jgi:DNA-directed RNA polymerase specialized sigma24 family protein